MELADIIRILAGLGLAGIGAVYVVEAWNQSKERAFLCLLVPFYLFYFAYVRSTRSLPFRVALVLCTVLIFVPSPRNGTAAQPPAATASP